MKKKLFAGAALLGALAMGLGIGATSTAAEPAGAFYADSEEDTFRIWFNRNGNYQQYGEEWKISFGESTYTASNYVDIYDNGSVYLVSFDLPVSLVDKELTLTAYSGDNATDAVITFEYESGDNAQVYYINYSATAETNWFVSQGTAHQYKDDNEYSYSIQASAIGTVLEAYYTCSADKDNGYGNFAQVFETWICEGYGTGTDNENWLITGNLSDTKIADYTDADYANGTKTEELVDLWSKATYMLELYNENIADEASSESIVTAITGNSGVALAALGALAAVAVVGVGTYLIISRRKKA